MEIILVGIFFPDCGKNRKITILETAKFSGKQYLSLHPNFVMLLCENDFFGNIISLKCRMVCLCQRELSAFPEGTFIEIHT